MVSQPVIVRERHDVLRGIDADLLHPFGIHVQTTSGLFYHSGVKYLPFLAMDVATTVNFARLLARRSDDCDSVIRECFSRGLDPNWLVVSRLIRA